MKTIIVLNNIFAADMIKDFEYLKEHLDMKKYNLVSALMFTTKENNYDTKEFTLKLIGSAISLGNMYNEFNTIQAIASKNKTTIYYGLAHLNVKYDEVYCVNKVVLDTQEAFIDDFLKKNQIRFDYIHSAKSIKDFKNIEEFVGFINDLQ
jgi:hypothetical protein